MKELTHKEVASRGGKSTLARYGKKHFSKLGKIKGKKTAQSDSMKIEGENVSIPSPIIEVVPN